MQRLLPLAVMELDSLVKNRSVSQPFLQLTISPTTYYIVQHSHEIGEDCIGVMETGEDRDDIRARVCVFFVQDGP